MRRGAVGETLPWETARDEIRFAPGQLTIWAGAAASFKSTVLSQVVLGFAEQGSRSLVTTLEEPAEEYGLRLTTQALAEQHPPSGMVSEFHQSTDDLIQVWDVQGSMRIDRVLKMMKYCAVELGAKHFIFDNVTKVIDPSNDAATAQWQFINNSHTLARQLGMHVHLVMHSRKEGRDGTVPTMNDIRGSSSSVDLADQVIMTWRNRLKEDVQQGSSQLSDAKQSETLKQPDVLLCIEKAKFGGREGKIGLWADRPTRLFFHGSNIEPKQTRLLQR
jgi:twinkle protein